MKHLTLSCMLHSARGDIAQLVELRSCNWVVAITGWMSNCPGVRVGEGQSLIFKTSILKTKESGKKGAPFEILRRVTLWRAYSIHNLSFMDVDKILPFNNTLGWHSLKLNGEVQTRKGLRWIPRHPETRKGVASDEMLRGVENKHRSGDSRIDNLANINILVARGKESENDSRSSGERNGSSLNRKNGVVGEQYKRRAARRSGGVLHPRWRESSSRKHH
ncbi:hypothetical protein AQUCO_06400042v1 [Aquilegia coerulea]|uniref:Uncharacterized protein n=1 Tax=Aquilegia coerulea TaxID=218851 RepID=A0A2G5CCH7_AQUCA|nr:hypothetical protein AQUCO_06400042v1 [Aquilegia coerulea]